MNTQELRNKIGDSSFNAIIKHPYYKEHLYTSHHDPVFHHETTSSGSHSTIRADVPFGGKKKTITFQYHKNKVYNAHYALDGKHIRSHKEVKESMEHINELSAKVIQSYLNKLKAKKRAESEPVNEAKIGDKVTVTHGSQKGLTGHVGEIRKGLGGKDHTYTVDYDDNGKRQSVQVKKAHTKLVRESAVGSILSDDGKKKLAASVASKAKGGRIPFSSTVRTDKGTEVTHGYTDSSGKRHVTKTEVKEGNDELNKKTPSEADIMQKHGINKTELDHHLAIGIKVEMEHTKNAAVAREIALDHINEKPDYYAKLKKMVEETELEEASIYSSSMAGRGKVGMVGKKPNASDMATHGTYNVTVKHSEGEKTYKLKNMKDSRHAQNTAMKIHRKDNPAHKIDTTSANKVEVNEEAIVEVSKRVLGRYIEKAATSMSSAAFGQGQASASRRPPSEKDQKTGMKRMTGIARATSKLTKEEAEQVDELKKSTLSNYLDKTVDPVHGMPRSAEKLPQRMKGIERATKKLLAKEDTIDEQGLYLTVPDNKEKETVKRAQMKKKRETFIHHKDRESHQTHMGMHEEVELKPHSVSVQLKHPHYEGVTRKIVKVNAKSTSHAEDIVATHYGRRGFKVHKVDYSKLHKEAFPKSAEEKQADEVKKEDSKVKKIAKAVKDAIK